VTLGLFFRQDCLDCKQLGEPEHCLLIWIGVDAFIFIDCEGGGDEYPPRIGFEYIFDSIGGGSTSLDLSLCAIS
jgi:hypothetical protein